VAKMGVYGGSKRYSVESYALSVRTRVRYEKVRNPRRGRKRAGETAPAPQAGFAYRLVGGRLVKVPAGDKP
jgi:hypothetical protein